MSDVLTCIDTDSVLLNVLLGCNWLKIDKVAADLQLLSELLSNNINCWNDYFVDIDRVMAVYQERDSEGYQLPEAEHEPEPVEELVSLRN